MINFDNIPTTNPNALPAEGYYLATIEKADMVAATKPENPPELNLTLALQDATGKKCGKIFDRLRDSDKQAQLYKIGRFVKALDLQLTGNIELKDLAKLVVGKQLVVDVEHYVSTNGKTYAQVALFKHDCYYNVAEFPRLTETDELPFEDKTSVKGADEY